MSTLQEFKQEVNAAKVSADLLGEVMIMWAALPSEEWKDFDTKLTRVVEHITRKNKGKEDVFLAMVLTLRLMALDSVLHNDEFKGLKYPGTAEGITFVHGDLLKAAAEEPIFEGPEGQPIFEGKAFCQNVLRRAATTGHA